VLDEPRALQEFSDGVYARRWVRWDSEAHPVLENVSALEVAP
jgi:hypothetical protein